MADIPPSDVGAWGAIIGTVTAGIVAIVSSICHTVEKWIMRKKEK